MIGLKDGIKLDRTERVTKSYVTEPFKGDLRAKYDDHCGSWFLVLGSWFTLSFEGLISISKAEIIKPTNASIVRVKKGADSDLFKLHSTKPLERYNVEIKCRTEVASIFPRNPTLTRLVQLCNWSRTMSGAFNSTNMQV